MVVSTIFIHAWNATLGVQFCLADHPQGTGCWLGDPGNVHGRAWFNGDPKIITKCENYGLNPVKLALALTEALFTREEMAASNVRGTRGKESLDPSKIKAIRGRQVDLRDLALNWFLFQVLVMRVVFGVRTLFMYVKSKSKNVRKNLSLFHLS